LTVRQGFIYLFISTNFSFNFFKGEKMSYRVSITAETPKELRKKLVALLDQDVFAGETVTTTVRAGLAVVEEESDEEMEDVPSPYTGKPSIDRSTVVDNEVDAEGIPWDDRIHASSKAKVKDGTWRTKRGVEDATIYEVKKELRARVGAVAAPVQQEIAAPVAQPTVVAPSPAPVPPMMNNNGHTLETFKANFPVIIGNLVTQGKINQDYVNQLKAHYGVAEIWMATDAHKEEMFNGFVQYGFIQKVG
jgi:hypothetical protein